MNMKKECVLYETHIQIVGKLNKNPVTKKY